MSDGYLERNDGSAFYLNTAIQEMSDMFDPETTAHALSMMCRYNGHTKRFYPVAEHTFIMAKWVFVQSWSTAKDALIALHHDDAEEIIGDMISPVKKHDQYFRNTEAILDTAIARRYDLTYPFPKWLKQIDARIVKDERKAVINPSTNVWGIDSLEPLGVKFKPIVGRIPWLMTRQWVNFHNFLERQRWVDSLDYDEFHDTFS